jgi:hypothetical protein
MSNVDFADARWRGVPVRAYSKFAVSGSVATLLVAFGAREFLRLTGGYYCCIAASILLKGALFLLLGWALLLYVFTLAADYT